MKHIKIILIGALVIVTMPVWILGGLLGCILYQAGESAIDLFKGPQSEKENP